MKDLFLKKKIKKITPFKRKKKTKTSKNSFE